MMFERFTHPARAAVVQAQQQARGLGHTEVRAEHLLLGVLADPDSIAARVLAELGVQPAAVANEVAVLGDADAEALRTIGIDLAAVRRQAETAFGPGALDRPVVRRRGLFRRPVSDGGHLRFTDAAKHALNQSLRQAQALHHNYIGTEHLLLGLIAQDNDPVALTLQRLGVAADSVRERIRAALAAAA